MRYEPFATARGSADFLDSSRVPRDFEPDLGVWMQTEPPPDPLGDCDLTLGRDSHAASSQILTGLTLTYDAQPVNRLARGDTARPARGVISIERMRVGGPNGTRTRAAALKEPCPNH